MLVAEKGLPREGFREAGFDSDEIGSPKGLGSGEEVDVARVVGSDLEGGAPKGFATPAGLVAPSRAPAASEFFFCSTVVG